MKKKEAFLERAKKSASDPNQSMKWLKFYAYPRFVCALIFWIFGAIIWIPMYLLCTTGMESRRVVIAKFILSIVCFVLEIIAVKAIRRFKYSASVFNPLLLIVESFSGIFIFGVDNLAFDKNSHEQSFARLAFFAVLSLLWLILNTKYFGKRKKIFTDPAPETAGDAGDDGYDSKSESDLAVHPEEWAKKADDEGDSPEDPDK